MKIIQNIFENLKKAIILTKINLKMKDHIFIFNKLLVHSLIFYGSTCLSNIKIDNIIAIAENDIILERIY